FETPFRNGPAAARYDDRGSINTRPSPDGRPKRQQAFVDDGDPVAGVEDDVGQFVGMEAEIERMEDAAHQRDSEVCLEVLRVVPGQGRDPVAGVGAKRLAGSGEAAGALG